MSKKIQMVRLGKSEVGERWFMKKPEAKNLVTLSLGKRAARLRKAVGPKMAAGLKRWQ
jgi:hypothetical protein